MRRFVLSTVGTSLLTNQIDRSNEAEKNWYALLRDSANVQRDNLNPEILQIIETLSDRATAILQSSTVPGIRRASAELNGIYGIYDGNLSDARMDSHWLISTDTAQGIQTSEVVKSFLESQGIFAQIYTPDKLSTADTEEFGNGIDSILEWLENTIPGHKEAQDRICFNLVGGFKSLQAYLNTIGMFYADEIVYIFESPQSELIKIPRLPLQFDTSGIDPMQFALMSAGAWIKLSEINDSREALLYQVEDEVTLSNWGRLIWNQSKSELLSQDLLSFPRLIYQDSFRSDYQTIRNSKEKVKLQETLAKVSYLLSKHQGNTGPLKQDGGVLYEVYTNKGGIAHFRVTQGIRISCTSSDGQLTLRRYGTEPDVNNNP
ncbi:MAG: CRISPR-associated protein [Arthrospira platensis PCC 7345]|uniref:CRISPR-associated protein n=1 Tax=Limnospira platensis TaxID=118562 RepID=UPI0012C775DE|nr:CRISPR-associated protein [Arthrospira sp. PLM2.Bin9]MDT9295471.1 CRISPR-associated protein [Arthrospira platensis PCC 7345]TVU52892.1 MAG: CRISPR-associated protein [Arthrospira sp. PLM2.Bin9]